MAINHSGQLSRQEIWYQKVRSLVHCILSQWLIDYIHFQRFTSIEDAKKMCPHLVVQHVATYRNGENEAGYWDNVDPRTHKVSLDVYRRESLRILAIFKEKIPRGEIGKSIEANRGIYLTVTLQRKHR